jgi:hypothetical protein
MAAPDKTMFEIYRDSDYNRAFHYIFYTDLEEHAREREIAKAASGVSIFSGFLWDDHKEDARTIVETIVEELNDLDEDDADVDAANIANRLAPFLAS